MKKIIIGSRGSRLSLAYAAKIKGLLLKKNLGLKANNIKFLSITTAGDINKKKKISEIGGKNLFCKEIEERLINKKIDIAVHSLKDMDSRERRDLIIGAFIKRNDPREVFISKKYKHFKNLNTNLKIGSSSRRRELQLKLINKNIKVKSIRGNVETRIQKLKRKKFDGVILAAAGVKSLNLNKFINFYFSTDKMIPSAGQGIIAAQCRKKDKKIKKILNKINNKDSNICATAEREMLKSIGGDCHTAVGALATLKNNKLKLKAQLFSDDGKKSFYCKKVGNSKDPVKIGRAVGKSLLKLAGKEYRRK